MKIGLIADVHGNLHAFKAVLAALETEGVDFTLCAGDLVGYGAQPSGVIRLMRERGIPSVCGNYDYAVAQGLDTASRTPSSPRNEVLKRAALRWALENVTPNEQRYLGSLPWMMRFAFDGLHVAVVHAGLEYLDAWYEPEYPQAMESLSKRIDADVIVMGHTHRSFAHRVSSRVMVNPGAVGRSLDGDTRAAFAVLDTDTLEIGFHRVEYDLRGAVRMIEKSGMPPGIARLIERGARRIEQVEPEVVEANRVAASRLDELEKPVQEVV
jgi:putative phosphoesterase